MNPQKSSAQVRRMGCIVGMTMGTIGQLILILMLLGMQGPGGTHTPYKFYPLILLPTLIVSAFIGFYCAQRIHGQSWRRSSVIGLLGGATASYMVPFSTIIGSLLTNPFVPAALHEVRASDFPFGFIILSGYIGTIGLIFALPAGLLAATWLHQSLNVSS